MELREQPAFLQYLSVDEQGQYIAEYNGLSLQSVYQPIFTRSYDIAAVEALVRITTRDKGNILPDVFFTSPQYADSDKIHVERLCRAIHIRNFANSTFSNLSLFLNMLPLVGEEFIDNDDQYAHFFSKLDALSIGHSQIVMELLETHVDDERRLCAITQKYLRNGMRVAIDDFGTGASTKHRVDLVKPSIIKFDRGLLERYMAGFREPLLYAIEVARNAQAQTVIEGIETAEQWVCMKALPIDYFQGFYLARPQPCTLNNRIMQLITN